MKTIRKIGKWTIVSSLVVLSFVLGTARSTTIQEKVAPKPYVPAEVGPTVAEFRVDEGFLNQALSSIGPLCSTGNPYEIPIIVRNPTKYIGDFHMGPDGLLFKISGEYDVQLKNSYLTIQDGRVIITATPFFQTRFTFLPESLTDILHLPRIYLRDTEQVQIALVPRLTDDAIVFDVHEAKYPINIEVCFDKKRDIHLCSADIAKIIGNITIPLPSLATPLSFGLSGKKVIFQTKPVLSFEPGVIIVKLPSAHTSITSEGALVIPRQDLVTLNVYLDDIAKLILKALIDGAEELAKWVGNAAEKATETAIEVMKDIPGAIENGVDKTLEAVGDGVGKTVAVAENVAEETPKILEDSTKKTVGAGKKVAEEAPKVLSDGVKKKGNVAKKLF